MCDSCGRPVVADARDTRVVCDECLADPPLWKQGRSALLYEGAGRKLVLAFKHGDRTDIALPASLWMVQAAKPMVQPNMVVVPVPLHRFRYLKRRYNQAALLAERLAKELQVPFCCDGLLRTRGLGSLEGLDANARAEKLRDAIVPNPKRQSAMVGKSVLLVDDVLTTGVTLSAATRACVTANAKDVRVVTLARVAKGT